MGKEVKVLIDKCEYDKLIQIENEYNSKNFYCEIGFVLSNRFSPFFTNRFYYTNEKIDIPKEIKEFQEALENIILSVNHIIIPENVNQEVYKNIFNKLTAWYNKRNNFK
jgi:hypothetical protein